MAKLSAPDCEKLLVELRAKTVELPTFPGRLVGEFGTATPIWHGRFIHCFANQLAKPFPGPSGRGAASIFEHAALGMSGVSRLRIIFDLDTECITIFAVRSNFTAL
jgi:hypothetical protein